MGKLKIFFALILLCSSCSKEKPEAPSPIPVKVQKVEPRDAPIFIDTIGHVDPVVKVEITSRVKGELTGVYFKQGDFVSKGDLLFTIDPRPFQATLDRAKASLEQNLASLKFAEEKVMRYASLTKEEYFSQIDFDQFQTDVETFSALVKQNQADVDQASVNLEYTWIYSPLDGRTGILKLDQGNLVRDDERQILISVNQITPIFVTFAVPERDLPNIQEYQKEGKLQTLVAFEDFSEKSFCGCLEIIDNMVEQQTGMVKLRALFANKNEDLWPGQFVKTRLILTTLKNSIVIPNQAVDITTTGTFVYVVKDDKTVEQRKVKTGQREMNDIIILDGLKAGETIVTEGLINLYPGASVVVREGK